MPVKAPNPPAIPPTRPVTNTNKSGAESWKMAATFFVNKEPDSKSINQAKVNHNNPIAKNPLTKETNPEVRISKEPRNAAITTEYQGKDWLAK